MWLAWSPSSVTARSYNHGSLRLVEPRIEKGKVVLWWTAPSGNRIRFYPRRWHPGWLARLRRAIRDKVRYVAAGGKYFQNNNKTGWVQLFLVKRVKRVFRGVRPVKLDGRMPIYLATVTPRHKTDRMFVYKIWGRVLLNYERHLNKMICLYGVWFDFQNRDLGLVSQVLGFRGMPLQQFNKKFKFPMAWAKIWKRRANLLRYQSAWSKGKTITLPNHIVPIVTKSIQYNYRNRCTQYLTRIEKRQKTPVDLLYNSTLVLPAFLPLSLFYDLYSLPRKPKQKSAR